MLHGRAAAGPRTAQLKQYGTTGIACPGEEGAWRACVTLGQRLFLCWPFLHAFNETAAVFFKHGPQTTCIRVSKEAADMKIPRPQLRFMKSESLGTGPRNRHVPFMPRPVARQLIHTAGWRSVEPMVSEVSAAPHHFYE